MRYTIEHLISTLAHNAVMAPDKPPASFTIDTMEFSHWDFNYRDGWPSNLWLARDRVEAPDLETAVNNFRRTLGRIVPRISLISQCYIEFVLDPFLVVRAQEKVAFLRYMKDRRPTGLMFMEKDLQALRLLLAETPIPEEFYHYWQDVINAVGYTPKLLLMCSAIESLAKRPNGRKDWPKIKKILGPELEQELFAPRDGLRNRLTHGEYLSPSDSGKNYVELVHKKIVAYFNREIFKADCINADVVNPQRHFWGNKEGGGWFIRAKDGAALRLKDVIADFAKNDMYHLEHYDFDSEVKWEDY